MQKVTLPFVNEIGIWHGKRKENKLKNRYFQIKFQSGGKEKNQNKEILIFNNSNM